MPHRVTMDFAPNDPDGSDARRYLQSWAKSIGRPNAVNEKLVHQHYLRAAAVDYVMDGRPRYPDLHTIPDIVLPEKREVIMLPPPAMFQPSELAPGPGTFIEVPDFYPTRWYHRLFDWLTKPWRKS